MLKIEHKKEYTNGELTDEKYVIVSEQNNGQSDWDLDTERFNLDVSEMKQLAEEIKKLELN